MPEPSPERLTPLQQFAEDVRQEVRVRCAEDAPPDQQEDAFTEWVLEQLAEHNEADDGEVLNHRAESRGRWSAAKLNAWALSGDGATLDLFVALYHGKDGVPTVGLPETRRRFKLLLGFLRRAREGFHTQLKDDHDVFEVARRIHEAKDSLTTVRLFFLTDGVARAEDIEQEKLDGVELRYILWDLKKLSQLRVGHREVIELDFAGEFGGAIPCLADLENTKEYQTYLAFMPGRVLARIYGEHGQRLLERNVRAFLQVKGKVNKGLQQTLRETPHRFLAYNNGLCCTAAEVRLEKRRDGQMGLGWVRDFQIVNGGQTTASIYHALKKERLDIVDVVVQVKLTVLKEPERIGELVPLIAKFANSQNKVNAADLAANGPFHHQLEQLSRTVWAPATGGLARGTHWYYERARGSFLDDKARQGTPTRRRDWEKLNPSNQKFTKTDLAKYEHAWLGLPHLVCLGAEKNFVRFAERMEDDGEPEVNLDFFRHTVAKTILWRTAEKLFDTLDLEGYRANSVAYAMAWLAEKSGRRIDLYRIWNEQRLSPALCETVKAVCSVAWEHLNHQQGNVGEASKKAECWQSFRSKEIALGQEWRAELAERPFVTPRSEEEALAAEWERLRHRFITDIRTIEGLEAYTGKEWVRTRRNDPISSYAVLTWEQLRQRPGLGLKKIRALVEMLAIAAQG
ncbi:MAG: AIPR family protein [Chloroflexi bacterium]|nr:AIPR family protein [Chloroflexota bacterium]